MAKKAKRAAIKYPLVAVELQVYKDMVLVCVKRDRGGYIGGRIFKPSPTHISRLCRMAEDVAKRGSVVRRGRSAKKMK